MASDNGGSAAPAALYGRMARRLELLEAAIEVIRREGPTASMDEIAAQAGITKPIVYRYFGDRAGLYQAVAERYCADLSNRFQSAVSATDVHARMMAAVGAYLAFVEDDPQVHQFLLHPQHATRPAGTFGHHVGEVIADVVRQRLEAVGQDPEPAGPWGHAIAGIMQAASTWWLVHPEVPRAKLVEHVCTLLWDGLERSTVPA
ncbi:MAG TPA: TetR/AcrR family transcriptional regulator [Actinomycetes bacterium]|jgi:AcrR family transcriptional regulator|nr:TetR/AcrR family transcriptional regulator [Actinomycetes bacterium]